MWGFVGFVLEGVGSAWVSLLARGGAWPVLGGQVPQEVMSLTPGGLASCSCGQSVSQLFKLLFSWGNSTLGAAYVRTPGGAGSPVLQLIIRTMELRQWVSLIASPRLLTWSSVSQEAWPPQPRSLARIMRPRCHF